MTRDELIAAMEKASGPSRELDWGIHEWVWGVAAPRMERMEPPSYTASIDAALTLVPEGYDWMVFSVNGFNQANCGPTNSFDDVGDQKAATHAIALCIAALKARA